MVDVPPRSAVLVVSVLVSVWVASSPDPQAEAKRATDAMMLMPRVRFMLANYRVFSAIALRDFQPGGLLLIDASPTPGTFPHPIG